MSKIADKAKAAVAATQGAKAPAATTPQTLKGLKSTDISKIFDRYALQIAAILPRHLDPKKMLQIFTTYVRRNPEIAECTTESVIGALMQCAELGFVPTPALQQVCFIPRRNRHNQNRKELEFQVMYQGLVDLAMRSGQVKSVRARVVYENDDFEVRMGTQEEIIHKPNLSGKRGNPILVYAIIEYTNGGYYVEIMTRDEVMKVREQSDSKNSQYSPWKNWEEMMWRKVALKRALKYAPKSTEIQRVIAADEQTFDETGQPQEPEAGPLPPRDLEPHEVETESEPEQPNDGQQPTLL